MIDAANMITPPEMTLFQWSIGLARAKVLHTVAEWGVADLLETHGRMSGAELASRLGTDPDATHRMMRACAVFGLFDVDQRGRFGNTRLSRTLLSDREKSQRHSVLYFGSASNVAAWLDFENVVKTGRNAFQRVFGKTIWAWLEEHPDEGDTYVKFMSVNSMMDAPEVVRLYPDFASIRTICDVGGGRGVLLGEILQQFPTVRGILVDGPAAVASAEHFLASRKLLDRVEVRPGSFFDSATIPRGADAYVLKNVMHNWDDATCGRILNNVRAACEPGCRLLIVDALLERNEASFSALNDLHMMTVCVEGRERGREEFASLLRDAGFELARVFPSYMAVIEARAV